MDEYDSYSYSTSVDDGGGQDSAPVWIIVLINVILASVTILGNFTVILSYIRDEEIRKTVAYMIILNLSITDILVGIFIFPLNTLWWINDKWAYGPIPCKLWLVLDYSVLSMSTWTLVYISLDRYWLLTMGLHYRRIQTTKKVLVVLGVAWAITVMVYLSIAFLYPAIIVPGWAESDSEDCELEVVSSRWFNFFEMIVQFVIPFSALVFLNVKVYGNIRERAGRLVLLKYDVSDSSGIHSNTTDLDENGSTPGARQSSTTDMGLEQPSDGIRLSGVNPGTGSGDTISTHSPSLVSLENDEAAKDTSTDSGLSRPASAVSAMTTDGESSRPNSAAMEVVVKTVTSLQPDSESPVLVDDNMGLFRLETSTREHETPVEKKRRKTHYRREKTEFESYRKAAVMLAALVTVFCFCWLPYYICAIIRSFCESCIGWRTWEVVSYFQWCNSAINPFIYAFTNVLFRRSALEFMKIDKCLKKKYHGSCPSGH